MKLNRSNTEKRSNNSIPNIYYFPLIPKLLGFFQWNVSWFVCVCVFMPLMARVIKWFVLSVIYNFVCANNNIWLRQVDIHMKSGRKPYYSEFRYYLYVVVNFSLATFLLIYSLSFNIIKFFIRLWIRREIFLVNVW